MSYLMFICGDGTPASDAEEEFALQALGQYVEDTTPSRVFGCPVLGPETATTVRVRDGETLLSDGPFVETKEHIVGFDIVDVDDREAAIAIAAQHPMSWFHRVEVRPFGDDGEGEPSPEVRARLNADLPEGKTRYLLMVVTDGSTTDAERATVAAQIDGWIEQHDRSGARVFGRALGGAETAATVRMRGPHLVVSDGPFAETKEYIAGLDVIECDDLDEAIAVAASHPVAQFHEIEIRPLTTLAAVQAPLIESLAQA